MKKVDETRSYPTVATQGYQRTKIVAEQLVLDANEAGLATCSLRPGHIFGAGDDLFFLRKVGVNFGPQVGLSLDAERSGAPMSMVHVENMAAAHLIAAAKLTRETKGYRTFFFGMMMGPVAGEAFNIADFNQNIVSLYHEAAGASPPFATLDYWFLWSACASNLRPYGGCLVLSKTNVFACADSLGAGGGGPLHILPHRLLRAADPTS